MQPLRVPDEDALRALPEPVVACPDCGSLGIRPLRLGEGGVPGSSDVSDARTCPRCGYRGLAVEFDRREDYAEFLRRLAGGA